MPSGSFTILALNASKDCLSVSFPPRRKEDEVTIRRNSCMRIDQMLTMMLENPMYACFEIKLEFPEAEKLAENLALVLPIYLRCTWSGYPLLLIIFGYFRGPGDNNCLCKLAVLFSLDFQAKWRKDESCGILHTSLKDNGKLIK